MAWQLSDKGTTAGSRDGSGRPPSALREPQPLCRLSSGGKVFFLKVKERLPEVRAMFNAQLDSSRYADPAEWVRRLRGLLSQSMQATSFSSTGYAASMLPVDVLRTVHALAQDRQWALFVVTTSLVDDVLQLLDDRLASQVREEAYYGRLVSTLSACLNDQHCHYF